MLQVLKENEDKREYLRELQRELEEKMFNEVEKTVEEKLKDFNFNIFTKELKKSTDDKNYLYHFDFLTSDKYIHSIVIGYDDNEDLFLMKIGRAKINKDNCYKFNDFTNVYSIEDALCAFGDKPITAYDPDLKDSYKWELDQVLWYLDYLIYTCEWSNI